MIGYYRQARMTNLDRRSVPRNRRIRILAGSGDFPFPVNFSSRERLTGAIEGRKKADSQK